MNYRIVTTDDFDREVKKLSKKYRSLKKDLDIYDKIQKESITKEEIQQLKIKHKLI